MNMTKIFYYTFSLSLFFVANVAAQPRVIAHRGYWDCEGAAQNSVASLNNSHKIGVYGSEFDVIQTSDHVLVVHHDASVDSMLIEATPYSKLKNIKLSNGEKLPTLKEYLTQGRKNKGTQLILEIKPHSTPEKENKATDAILKMVAKMKMEPQVEFISFSLNICQEVHRLNPKAKISYLKGDLEPEKIKEFGFTGIDYNLKVFQKNINWIADAKKLGLTVNVWTVDSKKGMQEMIDNNVDFITTNKPLALKALLNQ